MKSFSPTASRRLDRPLPDWAAEIGRLPDAAMRVRMEKYWDANS
jgi:hypothetical protein